MKKIYRFLFAGVLALCATGCSSSLLDIENPNEVTNTTFWKSADDAKAGVNACYKREAKTPDKAPPSTQPINALEEVMPCITLLY